MAQPRHGDDRVVLGQLNAPDPGGGAPGKHAHAGDRETDAFAAPGRQQDIVVLGAGSDPDQPVALGQLHGNLAVGLDVDEILERITPDPAGRGGEHDVELAPAFLVLGQGHHGGDGLAVLQRQQVDQCPAPGLGRPQRQLVDLKLVNDASGREEQHRRVGVDHEHLVNEILLMGAHAGPALAAAALGPVGRKRHPLDVAGVGDRDHHVLALDQVLDIVLELAFLDDGAARVGELLLHLQKLLAKQIKKLFRGPQKSQVAGDLVAQLLQVAADLVPFQPGQPVQT